MGIFLLWKMLWTHPCSPRRSSMCSRELALDQAKIFYELFNLTPKELLTSIVERGAGFKELDYMNALQLLHRSASHPDPASLTQNMEKLSQILRGVAARPGVTV